MFTKVTQLELLKQMYLEQLLDKTDKVTKVSDGSVLNGIAFGTAKIGQKIMKDTALIEAHLFPDSAYGSLLDEVAELYGVTPRFTTNQSSGYIRISAAPGTQYLAGIHQFISSSGLVFDITSTYTVGAEGFGYIPIRSQITGSQTNVAALSIRKIVPLPPGHTYAVNEYNLTGGRDTEPDEDFRQRIKDVGNLIATSTIARIEQVFIKINPNVLKVFHFGTSQNGKVTLGVITVNGANLTVQEISNLMVRGERYLSLTEHRSWGGTTVGIEIVNIPYYPVDISFRCDLYPSADPDVVRKEAQISMNKYFDYRYWKPNQAVQWDDLLEIAKRTSGIKFVYDKFFVPQVDINIPSYQLPRVRGFLMLDRNGNVIVDASGGLDPTYYPNVADFSFISTTLKSV